MTTEEISDLKAWARTKTGLGLKGLVPIKGSSEWGKARIINWLVENDIERLAESRRIEQTGLRGRPTKCRLGVNRPVE